MVMTVRQGWENLYLELIDRARNMDVFSTNFLKLSISRLSSVSKSSGTAVLLEVE